MDNTIRVVPWQNLSKFTAAFEKWFVKAFYEKTFSMDELVEHIAQDSGVERAVVAAALQAIMKQIGELLCNGHPIRIPHLGLMRLGVTSTGADTLKAFNARTNIKDLYVNLVPDKEIKTAIGKIRFVKYAPKKKKFLK